MLIQQISVFLENTPGALRDLTRVLGMGGIDLMALSIADTQNFGIVRLIVRSDSIDRAMELLKGAGYMARINHVICAEIPDAPGGLCGLLSIIEENGLSVEYMYSCRRTPAGDALMVLRLSEQDRGCTCLRARGVRVYNQEEVDKL